MDKDMCLQGKVCVVTGATKGIGRGIALQLGQHGAKVYITGRSSELLEDCRQEIKSRGGQCVPVPMDHNDDNAVEALFIKVKVENGGRLDVLVNNVYQGVPMIFDMMKDKKKFYEEDPGTLWDTINGVGLRNHFLCTSHAAKMMVKYKSGLIVNISSIGGAIYLFNVAYGAGKAACDKMASDAAQELKDDNVTMVSLWPGPVKTEYIQDNLITPGKSSKDDFEKKQAKMFDQLGESQEFAGMCIAHLAKDPNVLDKSGKILYTSDLAREYGFIDPITKSVNDCFALKTMMNGNAYLRPLSWIVPGFIRVPKILLHFMSYRF